MLHKYAVFKLIRSNHITFETNSRVISVMIFKKNYLKLKII